MNRFESGENINDEIIRIENDPIGNSKIYERIDWELEVAREGMKEEKKVIEEENGEQIIHVSSLYYWAEVFTRELIWTALKQEGTVSKSAVAQHLFEEFKKFKVITELGGGLESDVERERIIKSFEAAWNDAKKVIDKLTT